jgi:hypothetical protein
MDHRRSKIAGTAVLALLLGGCKSPAQVGSWAVGACALVDDRGTASVGCSEPHTHRVIAIVKDAEHCPRDTDMYSGPADPSDSGATVCFQSDTTRQ